jgi:cell division protein FtsB
MFDFHEKRKIRSIVYSRPVVGLLVVLTLMLSTSVYHRYTVATEMKQKLVEREQELEGLRQRAQLLESKVQYMQDDRGIEEELRNRFDVVKEGEQVIILIDPEEKEDVGTSTMYEGGIQKNVSSHDTPSFIERLKFWE